jgi:hypothetical protein
LSVIPRTHVGLTLPLVEVGMALIARQIRASAQVFVQKCRLHKNPFH